MYRASNTDFKIVKERVFINYLKQKKLSCNFLILMKVSCLSQNDVFVCQQCKGKPALGTKFLKKIQKMSFENQFLSLNFIDIKIDIAWR